MVKPHQPVLVPTGTVNTTERDSRVMRTQGQPPLQGYNAQLAVNDRQVYCDPSHYSLTGVIRAPRLASRFATNFFSTRQFFRDAEQGELPTYSFIEPQIIGWNHNDMHPPFGGVVTALGRQLGAEDAARACISIHRPR